VDRVGGNTIKQTSRFSICRRIRFRLASWMDAERNDSHAFGRDQAMSKQFIANCNAVTGDASSLAKSVQNAFGHHPKQFRFLVTVGVKQTAESVKVVTRDDRSSGRQIMHELRIALINHVKDIKCLNVRLDKPLVIPETTHQSV